MNRDSESGLTPDDWWFLALAEHLQLGMGRATMCELLRQGVPMSPGHMHTLAGILDGSIRPRPGPTYRQRQKQMHARDTHDDVRRRYAEVMRALMSGKGRKPAGIRRSDVACEHVAQQFDMTVDRVRSIVRHPPRRAASEPAAARAGGPVSIAQALAAFHGKPRAATVERKAGR